MSISNKSIPKHIALIMDGNGRWAKEKHQPRIFGHKEGVKRVKEIIQFCVESDEIKFLTLYTFSSENWKRPIHEVNALMKLLVQTLKKELKLLIDNSVIVKVIGNIEELSLSVRNQINKTIDDTKDNNGLTLTIALNYGSRKEIVQATKKICNKLNKNLITVDNIDEQMLNSELDTSFMPDPDLLIRTGKEFRLSNFLLWQLAYTEIYISDSYFPDFTKSELVKALNNFSLRERRFGKTSKQIV